MIIFTKVRWKNLLSTGNNFIEVDLVGNRTNILIGNSGSGKSTLLDAISFALFNRPFRNINKNQLVNMVNQKNCLVEIEFTIGTQNYLIRRGIKPAIFEIFCDQTMINQDSHTKDYQQYLERSILKFSFKAFTQIIVLGASNFTPFMQLKPSDRRVIIEGLLDIEIFSVMNILLKQRVSSLKSVTSENESAITMTKERVELQLKYISDLSHSKHEKIQENLSIIEMNKNQSSQYESEIAAFKESISVLKEQLNFKHELIIQMDNIKDIMSKFDSNIKKTKKEVVFYEDNDSCPTCQQNIPDSFKIVELEKKNSKITDWQKGISEAEGALTKFLVKLDEARPIEDKIESIQSQIVKNRSMIDGINQFIKKVARDTLDMKQQQDAPAECSERLAALHLEAQKMENNKQEYSYQKNMQDLATSLLKDSGVKSRIIKQYLPLINKHTNIFLNAMNFFVTFNIDEEFNENILSRGRDVFAYENFSEGEKQRIDLSLLFTWRTIAKMKNSVNTNLLIMDEVLDSYLDNTATENVLLLLNSDMFKDTNIFVISHKESISDKFKKTIRFTKSKNFSTLC